MDREIGKDRAAVGDGGGGVGGGRGCSSGERSRQPVRRQRQGWRDGARREWRREAAETGAETGTLALLHVEVLAASPLFWTLLHLLIRTLTPPPPPTPPPLARSPSTQLIAASPWKRNKVSRSGR